MAVKNQSALAKLKGRLRSIETEVVEREFVGLLYGDKGTGKTTTASALAQKLKGDGKILRLDSSDGWVSLDNIKPLKKDTDNLEYATVIDLAQIADAVLNRRPGFEDYTVVILDEVSTWYTEALHSFVREKTNTPENEPLPVFGWDMYGPVQAALGEVIRRFQKTKGLHLIMVAHEQERALKGDQQAKRMVPSMGTKLGDTLGQIAHVVARFESRQKGDTYSREVQSWPTRLVDAKSRIKGVKLKMEQIAWVNAVAKWVSEGRMEEETEVPDTSVIEVESEAGDADDFEVDDED